MGKDGKDKSKEKSNASKSIASQGDGDSDIEEEQIAVCKWDGTAVKNAMDDAVKEVLTEKLSYEEDHSLMDIRLIICGLAVAVAMFALAWDYFYPFPASRQVLIGCVGTYFIMMMVLTVYTTYKEKGIFVVVAEKDPAGLDPDSTWEASSNMKKFDDMYELILEYKDGRTGQTREDSFNRSAADFFDENGVLHFDSLEAAVLKLHKSLASPSLTKKTS